MPDTDDAPTPETRRATSGEAPSTPPASPPEGGVGPPDETAGPPNEATRLRSDDDSDIGWGDEADRAGPGGGRDLRWYEEQRPPHWE